MTKVGLLFSGQGAQVPGMGKDFYDKIPVFAETIDQASEICGFDLTECFGSSEMLKQTKYVQPALCAFSYGVFKALKCSTGSERCRRNRTFAWRISGFDCFFNA